MAVAGPSDTRKKGNNGILTSAPLPRPPAAHPFHGRVQYATDVVTTWPSANMANILYAGNSGYSIPRAPKTCIRRTGAAWGRSLGARACGYLSVPSAGALSPARRLNATALRGHTLLVRAAPLLWSETRRLCRGGLPRSQLHLSPLPHRDRVVTGMSLPTPRYCSSAAMRPLAPRGRGGPTRLPPVANLIAAADAKEARRAAAATPSPDAIPVILSSLPSSGGSLLSWTPSRGLPTPTYGQRAGAFPPTSLTTSLATPPSSLVSSLVSSPASATQRGPADTAIEQVQSGARRGGWGALSSCSAPPTSAGRAPGAVRLPFLPPLSSLPPPTIRRMAPCPTRLASDREAPFAAPFPARPCSWSTPHLAPTPRDGGGSGDDPPPPPPRGPTAPPPAANPAHSSAVRRPYTDAERSLVRSLLIELGWGRFDAIAAAMPTRRSVPSLRGLANSLRLACPAVAAAYARRRETARPAHRQPWTPTDDAQLIDAVATVGWGDLPAAARRLTKGRSKNAVVTRLSLLKKRSVRLQEAHRRHTVGIARMRR